MNVDLFSSTGEKKGSMELPASLFGGTINKGLMHLALVVSRVTAAIPLLT